ncbi:MAG: hypothetical protein JWM57_88, partial [Phycisphaerales bacterium]|nr:hypothetical protein [Phycisphaerales bacterium]
MYRSFNSAALRRAASSAFPSVLESLETRWVMSVAIPAAAQSYPGFDAGQMLADPVRNNVYVLDQTNHKVIEISTDLGRKIGQANVSDVPTSLAINPQGTELYVSSRQANAIQVYALPDLQPLRTLDVSQPGLIAVGIGDRVFVAGTSQWGSLRQVDGISGTLLHTFGSYYDALPKTSVAGTKLYLSELGLSTTDTDEYDISNPNITPASVKSYATNMSNGRDLAIDEKYNRLYSMSGGVYGVYHVDRATGTGGTWSFGGAAYGASVDVNEAASWFYATAQDPYNGGIFKYDRATGAVLTQYAPNGGYQSVWDVAETANGNAIYLADPGYSGSGQQLGIIGKTSLAIASIPNAAFTTSVSSGRVVSFDASASADYEANGTIASYVWDFGDGTTANGKTAGHTYAANGKYVIKLTVADAQGNTDDYSTTLNLSTAPVAANAVYTTQEETAVAVPLQGTDSDGDALTYAIAEQPAHGKLQLSGTTATYIPAKDFFGDDRFVYTVSDGGSTTAATVVIRVNNVNDAPVARDDLVARSPAGATLINVLGNDIDPDGDPLTITFTQPANGGVQLSGNKLLYTPAAGFVGADNFTYTISDGTATSSAKAYVSPQAATLSGEWTTFGGSAAHTGAFAGVTGPAAPVNGWAVLNDGNTTTLAVAVGNGRVFATQYSPSGYALSAYDATNGQLLWKHSFTSGFSINPPTYYNGRVYLTRCNHSSDTQLWAIDANTGNTIWSAAFQAQWESYYAPAVDASGIWINGGSYGGMYGFQHNGTQIKYIGLAQYDEWTPSILNGSVYSYVAGSFVKYDETGTASWTNTKSWSWNGWSMNRTTALAGNQAFLVGNPDFYSVNLTTGQTLWTVAGSFTGTAAVSGNTAYVIQGSTVKAYNTANGQLVNTYTTTDSLQLQPIVTDDSVIVASTSNTYVFDRATGKLRYMLAYGGQLSLANNRLIVAAPDGVHSFDFASPLAADAGSTYHVNEGASVTLSGAASSAGGAVSAWEWDFDYDGTTFNVDATGQNVTFSAANIDGPGRRRVALRVRDAAGNVSPVAGADVLIDNVAPTAAFAVTPTVMVGGVSVAQFSAPTDSAVDQAFGLRYSFDFNNDGDFTD